jgi:hypothetical protein
MLTCTVSMVENAIAIIATCLPALRSMLLGTNSSNAASNPYGKHYELSTAQRKANENLQASSHITGGQHSTIDTRHRAHGSEDSLFSNGSSNRPGVESVPGKITVNTQIQHVYEDTQRDLEASHVTNTPLK